MANPLFDSLFGKHAGKTQIFLHLPDGQTITYAEFLRMAAQYAGALTKFGLVPGDRL
ncbi:MAG: malonyl-CoA synthase, partial [Sulfitobacter sp.]|nr:malonyl-CoA synthase [Sulfitobacter sp.]